MPESGSRAEKAEYESAEARLDVETANAQAHYWYEQFVTAQERAQEAERTATIFHDSLVAAEQRATKAERYESRTAARAKAAESQVAELKEALVEIADGCPSGRRKWTAEEAVEIARAALTDEAKGGA